MPLSLTSPSAETRMKLSLCLLRMLLGAGFLVTGYAWFQDNHFLPNLPSILTSWADRHPYFVYQDLLSGVFIPHAAVFGVLMIYTHLALALCLLTGLAVRYAAPIGALVMLNYYGLAHHTSVLLEWITLFGAIGLLAVWIGGAGRCYGFDALFQKGNADTPAKTKPAKRSKSSAKKSKLNMEDIQSAFKKIKTRV